VTRPLPGPAEARARATYAVRDWSGRGALADVAQGADAILCTPADRLDGAAIAGLPASVRVIGTFSVGHEHIDVAAAAARGMAVVNTPGVLSDATAELTMLLILAAARRSGEGERLVRAGRWPGWTPNGFLGSQVSGKRLGILGMGRIGQVLARMARGFGMAVHYRNRAALPPHLAQGAVWHADEAGFLAQCDALAICAPATQETRLWLNAARLALLPRGAIVVNAARGSLVDDDALIAALRSGQVAAAGLDVFAHEPEVPPGYLALENVVLLPHIGSATVETRVAMGHLVLDGIDAVLQGRVPETLVRAAAVSGSDAAPCSSDNVHCQPRRNPA
jgi:lactate dehydrogenase-like 2-hydroxyacid dehydrogenase